jgi:hypothetical protein
MDWSLETLTQLGAIDVLPQLAHLSLWSVIQNGVTLVPAKMLAALCRTRPDLRSIELIRMEQIHFTLHRKPLAATAELVYEIRSRHLPASEHAAVVADIIASSDIASTWTAVQLGLHELTPFVVALTHAIDKRERAMTDLASIPLTIGTLGIKECNVALLQGAGVDQKRGGWVADEKNPWLDDVQARLLLSVTKFLVRIQSQRQYVQYGINGNPHRLMCSRVGLATLLPFMRARPGLQSIEFDSELMPSSMYVRRGRRWQPRPMDEKHLKLPMSVDFNCPSDDLCHALLEMRDLHAATFETLSVRASSGPFWNGAGHWSGQTVARLLDAYPKLVDLDLFVPIRDPQPLLRAWKGTTLVLVCGDAGLEASHFEQLRGHVHLELHIDVPDDPTVDRAARSWDLLRTVARNNPRLRHLTWRVDDFPLLAPVRGQEAASWAFLRDLTDLKYLAMGCAQTVETVAEIMALARPNFACRRLLLPVKGVPPHHFHADHRLISIDAYHSLGQSMPKTFRMTRDADMVVVTWADAEVESKVVVPHLAGVQSLQPVQRPTYVQNLLWLVQHADVQASLAVSIGPIHAAVARPEAKTRIWLPMTVTFLYVDHVVDGRRTFLEIPSEFNDTPSPEVKRQECLQLLRTHYPTVPILEEKDLFPSGTNKVIHRQNRASHALYFVHLLTLNPTLSPSKILLPFMLRPLHGGPPAFQDYLRIADRASHAMSTAPTTAYPIVPLPFPLEPAPVPAVSPAALLPVSLSSRQNTAAATSTTGVDRETAVTFLMRRAHQQMLFDVRKEAHKAVHAPLDYECSLPPDLDVAATAGVVALRLYRTRDDKSHRTLVLTVRNEDWIERLQSLLTPTLQARDIDLVVVAAHAD